MANAVFTLYAGVSYQAPVGGVAVPTASLSLGAGYAFNPGLEPYRRQKRNYRRRSGLMDNGLTKLQAHNRLSHRIHSGSQSQYGFDRLRDIVADGSGNVWVTENGHRGITKTPFDIPGRSIVYSRPQYRFKNPQAIAAVVTGGASFWGEKGI